MKNANVKDEKLLIYTFPVFLAIFTYSQLKGFNMLFARTWIWLFFAFAIAYNVLKKYFEGKALKWAFFYAFVVIINFLSGDGYFNSFGNVCLEVAVVLYCILISRYLCVKKCKAFARNTVILTIVIIIITCLLTLRMIMIMPGVVREIVVILNRPGGETLVLDFYRAGVCEYPFPHALPILIPPLVLWVLTPSNQFYRYIAILLLVLVFYFLFMCDVGTPLFVGVFVLVGSFMMSTQSFKKSLARVILLLLLGLPFLSKNVVISTLSMIEDQIEEQVLIKKKVTDIRTSVQYGESEGAVDDRQTLYDKSIEGFSKNFIWGTNDKQYIGGHSALLDRLSTLGILGALPFILLLYYHLKFIFDHLHDNVKSFFVMSIFAFVFMIAGKNMNGIYTWLFISIIAPCFLLFGCETKGNRINA